MICLNFPLDQRGENWVMCVMCQWWAHNECADYEKGVGMCDFFK